MVPPRNYIKRGVFDFIADDPIYKDHFPGNPVVPGSIIIHAFIEAIKTLKKSEGSRTIRNFRFKRFVSPGRYEFRIERIPDGRMACYLYDNKKVVVTGTL